MCAEYLKKNKGLPLSKKNEGVRMSQNQKPFNSQIVELLDFDTDDAGNEEQVSNRLNQLVKKLQEINDRLDKLSDRL